jgi:hypothetical protein
LARPTEDRPGYQGPRTSHRHSGTHRKRPPVSLRLVTAAGVTLAVVGGGIAVGTGAVHTPLSDSAARASTAADLTKVTARAPAASASASALGYAKARIPDKPAARHTTRHARRPAKASTTPTATPTGPAMTTAAAATAPVTARPTAKPVSTASAPPASGGLTPQATAEYQTPTGQNQLAWSEAILTKLGDPLTSGNILSIGYWMQNEAGTPPYGIVGANNPINVSEPGYGGTQIQYEAPGYYLMSYPTVQDGVAATAAYLNNGSYSGILSALKSGTGLVNNSSVANELSVYSGNGYSQIPDSWGSSQGTPET